MRKYFRSLADVLVSPIAAAANALWREKAARQDRVLQSTKLEDMIYQGLHKDDDELIALEQSCTEKLSTFSALSRDIYQSFYSLRVRKREEESLSAPSRRFNVPILKELMEGDSYPTIKAACEGRQIPAYEAAGEFISQVADNLDSLMEQAGGQKNALETLEHLEEKRDQSMERLQKLIEQMEQSGATPALETQLIKAANTAQSQSNQVEAVGRIVQENLQKHSGELTLLVKQASEAAAQTAIDVQLTLMSWGTGPDNSDPKSIAADTELVHRVQQNDTLMKVARYLGRLKELMEGKRKNGYAYGRGEKYTLELGADLSRALASEFVLLALPETTPLFLRKLHKKSLKQYQRREPIYKGAGDIICCLDESDSTEGAPAAWGKAVALTLLEIAADGGRSFALVHFSGSRSIQTDLFRPGAYTAADKMAAAEIFLGGGTNFETPMSEALRLMQEEGFENADVVFITDGQCTLSNEYLEQLRAEQAARRFTVTGILLDKGKPGRTFSLKEFCQDIYRTSELTGEEVVGALVRGRV